MSKLEVKGRAGGFMHWVVIGLVLAVLGWWAWDWLKDEEFLWRLLSFTLLVAGIVFAAFGAWKLMDKQPVLIATEQGLVDRTGMLVRRINWGEITGFRLPAASGRSSNFLAIDLVDPVKFVASASFGSSSVLEAIETQHGTPCVIPLKLLDIEPHNLIEHLKGYLRQHGS
ncbi:STM3941 family protein [Dokdonella sp.]|uniref:STM3941 family protein n=1 Tax=Dokdonella sp. TaxID=2291710 RepID=UPI003C60243F